MRNNKPEIEPENPRPVRNPRSLKHRLEELERPGLEGEISVSHPTILRGSYRFAGEIQSAIDSMESAVRVHESLALAYWRRVAGPQAAAASEAESVRDGILFVRTKSSVWSHELTLYKSRLLLGLNRLLGRPMIQDIVFRAQGITRTEAPLEGDSPMPEELAAVILEPEEKAELRARLEALISIPDDRIRHSIAVRLIQETRLRHWRLEHGWRVCPQCDATHKSDYRLCPICRLSK